MRASNLRDIQTALDFFRHLRQRPEQVRGLADLPARIDYEAVAAMARQNGFVVSPPAVAEAFRLMMRARRSAATSAKPEGVAVQ